jgi:Disulphide bond corrector protein DsbC
MTSSIFSTSSCRPRTRPSVIPAAIVILSAACLSAPQSFAQGPNVMSVAPPAKLTAKQGSIATATITLKLQSGYHCNSDKPKDEYLIPLKLTWTPAPLEVTDVAYPKPQMEKFSFSPEPMPVFTGDFEVVTRFKVPASAAIGATVLAGKLRYQACNDRMCLQPKTIDVLLPVDVTR